MVAIVAITGVLLNHTDALDLPNTTIRFAPVVAAYGLDSEANARHVQLGATALTQVENLLYLGDDAIGELQAQLVGAVVADAGIMVAARSELQLFTADGKLIERMLPAFGLPTPIEQLGIDAAGHAMLRTGGATYRFNAQLFEWQIDADATLQAAEVLDGVRPEFGHPPPTPGVSLEHLLLDLHTGRLLGRAGPWLNDLAAFGLCLLAATGLWMALRR